MRSAKLVRQLGGECRYAATHARRKQRQRNDLSGVELNLRYMDAWLILLSTRTSPAISWGWLVH